MLYAVIVSYARQSVAPKSTSSDVASAAIAQAQWSMVCFISYVYITVSLN